MIESTFAIIDNAEINFNDIITIKDKVKAVEYISNPSYEEYHDFSLKHVNYYVRRLGSKDGTSYTNRFVILLGDTFYYSDNYNWLWRKRKGEKEYKQEICIEYSFTPESPLPLENDPELWLGVIISNYFKTEKYGVKVGTVIGIDGSKEVLFDKSGMTLEERELLEKSLNFGPNS